MRSAETLVNELKNGGRKKEYVKASEWSNCSHAGCPMPSTIKAATCTCGYHYLTNGYNAECITNAIKELKTLINKYADMMNWVGGEWIKKKAQIMGWHVLPATEQEIGSPTLYLNKFKIWLDAEIKIKAEEFYKRGS